MTCVILSMSVRSERGRSTVFRSPGLGAGAEVPEGVAESVVAPSVESSGASASVGVGVGVVVVAAAAGVVGFGVASVVVVVVDGAAEVDSRICCEGMLLLHTLSGTLVLNVQYLSFGSKRRSPGQL